MSSNAWRTASTRRGRGKIAREMPGGRIVSAPGPAIPAGTCHAFLRGEERTACGLDVSNLVRWPHEWFLRTTKPSARCRGCLAAIRA